MSIAHYELLGRVYQTTAGSVWKGWDTRLEREVALKQVNSPSAAQWEQLRVEAAILGGLHHENIVSVFDLIEENEDGWLVQEWVNGVSLATIARHNSNLTPQQILSIVRGALLGLAHAHQQRMVHGDVTPANILVDLRGVSKLIDFGLAGRWGTPSLGGTPGFASPESLENQQLAPTSDVYSAAAVLAGLLLGKPLFAGPDLVAILAQQRSTPDLAGLATVIQQVLMRALAFDPADRQSDASVLLRELDDAVEQTYGTGWALVAGVAGLVSATTAAMVIVGQASTLGTSAIGGTAAATGSTASVATGTAGSTSIGIGSQASGLGGTGASDTGVDFVSDLSNTTGAGASPPDLNLIISKAAEVEPAGSSSVGAGSVGPAAAITAKPLVLVAAAAAVVVIVVAAVFLFGGGNDPQSPNAATETVAGSVPVVASEAETAASIDKANSSARTSATTSSTSSTSSSTTSTTAATTESAAAPPPNPALGFSGVYSYSAVLIERMGGVRFDIGYTATAVWDVTSTCEATICTAVVNSSSGKTYTFIEEGGVWKDSGNNVSECFADDTGEPTGQSVGFSFDRTLSIAEISGGHIEQLQGNYHESQIDLCEYQVLGLGSVTFTQTITYLGPEAVMTPNPTPALQTS